MHIQGKSGCFPEKENGGFERRKGYVKNIFHNKSSVRLEASGTGWILTVKDEFTENALTLTSEELKKLKDILNNKINI